MIVRSLNKDKDFTFGSGKSNYLSAQLAIVQNVETRLKEFLGDCFFNTQAGIDWFNLMDKGREADLLKSVQLVILGTDGVVGINSFDYTLVDRKLTVTYDIKTIYSLSYIDSVAV